MGYTAAKEDSITYKWAKSGARREDICAFLNVSMSYFANYLEKRYMLGKKARLEMLKRQQLQRLP